MTELPEGIVDYCREKLCVDLPETMKIDPNYARFIINVYSAGIEQGKREQAESNIRLAEPDEWAGYP